MVSNIDSNTSNNNHSSDDNYDCNVLIAIFMKQILLLIMVFLKYFYVTIVLHSYAK